MTFELNRLREQLSTLKDVYKDTLLNGASMKKKIRLSNKLKS